MDSWEDRINDKDANGTRGACILSSLRQITYVIYFNGDKWTSSSSPQLFVTYNNNNNNKGIDTYSNSH